MIPHHHNFINKIKDHNSSTMTVSCNYKAYTLSKISLQESYRQQSNHNEIQKRPASYFRLRFLLAGAKSEDFGTR